MSDPTSFSIEELTGQKRRLVLQGRALPYKPYTVKGTMRAEFTWYAGNPTASVQLLGSKEEPSTLKGQWKNRFLRSSNDAGRGVIPTAVATLSSSSSGGQQVADVQALVNAVDSIRRSGQLLHVAWGSLIREGILTSFTATWDRLDIVEWEMEFTWVSQGEKQIAPTVPSVSTVGDFFANLRNLVTSLQLAVQAPFNVVEEFAAEIFTSLDDIQSAESQLAGVATSVTAQIFTAQEAAERTLAIANTLKISAQAIQNTLDITPPRAIASVSDSSLLTVGQILAVVAYKQDVRVKAQDIVVLATAEADLMRAQAHQDDLLAAFVARDSMDLRDVSLRFYGTQDNWRTLLQFNHLASSKLSSGQLVFVPKELVLNKGA